MSERAHDRVDEDEADQERHRHLVEEQIPATPAHTDAGSKEVSSGVGSNMPNSLGPWEPDAEHPGTEVRRTRVGTRVLSLGPEGMPDSQCWAWMVLPAMRLPLRQGVNLGSDLDKEVARAAADAAAFAYGYDPKGIISEAPTIASKIVNLPLADAARMAQEVGVQFRIGRQDGRVYGLSDDLWFNRVTVTVMDGIVTEARIG